MITTNKNNVLIECIGIAFVITCIAETAMIITYRNKERKIEQNEKLTSLGIAFTTAICVNLIYKKILK